MTGLILLNKPTGISTFSALGGVKKALGTKKVGHAGTLDPFASGLVVALSEKMTKFAPMLTALDKEYRAIFTFGEETDTLDVEGKVVATAPVPNLPEIENAFGRFTGEIEQTPPAYSAIKIDGKRAYALARRGEKPALKPRKVTIHDLEILGWESPHLELRIICSKGTYIRSLARDWGLAVGSRAYCSVLERIAVGPFEISESVTPDEFTPDDLWRPNRAASRLGIPTMVVDPGTGKKIANGVPLDRLLSLPDTPGDGFRYLTDTDGRSLAFIESQAGRWRYRVVFDGTYPS